MKQQGRFLMVIGRFVLWVFGDMFVIRGTCAGKNALLCFLRCRL